MKFIHYGCWNNMECKKVNVRDLIIDYIEEHEKDYEFLIISGDNWYSNKQDNMKYYFTNVLRSGFIKLYNLNKTAHIILGNHDEDVAKNQPLHKLQKNCMLNTEKYYIQQINNNEAEYLVPSLQYLYENTDWSSKKDARLFLHEAHEHPEELFMSEYNVLFIFINTNIFFQKNTSKSYISKIKQCIEEYHGASQYFIVGHAPITSLVPTKHGMDISSISDDVEITTYFIDTLAPYNPIYLCADTHNFQITTINSDILQVVVGTGGAPVDEFKSDDNVIKYDFMDKKYKVSGLYHNAYGYSIIEINDDEVTITYKRLVDIPTNVVNKAYVYKLHRDGGKFVYAIKQEYDLDDKIDFDAVKMIQNEVCNNLTDEHLVKQKTDTGVQYCYKKSK